MPGTKLGLEETMTRKMQFLSSRSLMSSGAWRQEEQLYYSVISAIIATGMEYSARIGDGVRGSSLQSVMLEVRLG